MLLGLAAGVMLLSIVYAPPARADAGVGMLMVMSVPMWGILLVIIVPLEAWIAKRIFGISFLACLKISSLANFVSTVVGILFTWASLICYEWFWYNDPNTFWIVPVNELAWCVPCFFASIWIEGKVASTLVEGRLRIAVHEWSIKANVASYSILFLLLLALLIWSVASEYAMRNSDNHCDVDRISAERVWLAQYKQMKNGSGRFRKRSRPEYHLHNDGKPVSWLKNEVKRSYEVYPPSDEKSVSILESALAKYDSSDLSQQNAVPKDDLTDVLWTLALYYDKHEQFARARSLRLRHLKIEYGDVEELRLADNYMELGEIDAASKIYKKLAGSSEFYEKGHGLIGVGKVAVKRKDWHQAEANLQSAKDLFFEHLSREGSEYTEACVQLAECYIAEKRYSEAERFLLQETKYRDDSGIKGSLGSWPIPEYLLALSDCYLAQGDYHKTERCIKQAMRGQSSDSPTVAAKKYAEYLQKRGLAAEAALWFQRAKDTERVQEGID